MSLNLFSIFFSSAFVRRVLMSSSQVMGEKILDHIIRVASGETPSKAVLHGNNDFIPWKRGISL